ncbi:cardiolipin synthase [Corynebacterium bovis]|uniref:cardiolipin synthase n=1 Tax=Corynebacterium bovis TaxID=36808 RepID=UPI0024493BC5|nr:cardiolipin synthase [Corynebacterium bovis]MDH2456470.1 cardiolipin synthase [Corynebacterium bovis]
MTGANILSTVGESLVSVPFVGSLLQDGLEWWQVALIVLDYLLKFIALGWVPKDRRPTSAMAWLLAIFLLPFVGILLYFLMGSPYINRRRHRIQDRANELLRTITRDEPDVPPGAELTEELTSLVKLNRALTAIPATTGSLVDLHPDYDASIRAMADAVDRAETYVNVEIYIMAWDDTTDVFFRALERAVARGVKVHLMFDQVGSWKYPGYLSLGRRLDEIGVEWLMMLPLKPWRWRFRRPDLRNHRKILVIDGHTAFIGSQNMIDSSYLTSANRRSGRRWVDVMAQVTGPVVTIIDSVFAVDWYTESKQELSVSSPTELTRWLDERTDDDALPDSGADILQIIPSGPGFTTEPNLRLFTSVAHHAKHRLQLVSPYFIPDESLLEAVTTAAYRGVQVELYVSEKADQALVGHAQSSYYEALLRAGVEIHQYPAPAVLHSKFALADDEVALMGSSNMDMRSFGLNYEITVLTTGGDLLTSLRRLAATYKKRSHRLTLEEWSRRPWYLQYLDNVARLTSALQ